VVLSQLFTGLVDLTPEWSFIPGVARRWQILDGGHRYLFHLRDDFLWSDGTTVTAEDFIFGWRSKLKPSTWEEPAMYLFVLKGARDYYFGLNNDPDSIGARAVDELTI